MANKVLFGLIFVFLLIISLNTFGWTVSISTNRGYFFASDEYKIVAIYPKYTVSPATYTYPPTPYIPVIYPGYAYPSYGFYGYAPYAPYVPIPVYYNFKPIVVPEPYMYQYYYTVNPTVCTSYFCYS